jgi:hypothetical protein
MLATSQRYYEGMKTQKNGKGNNIGVIRLLIDLSIQNQGHSWIFLYSNKAQLTSQQS